MKKLLLIWLLSAFTNMNAADVVVDGISYNVNIETMEATVVKGDYAFRDIIIPETFNYNTRTFTVKKIGRGAFYNPGNTSYPPSYVTKLVIPHSVNFIEEKAISGTKYLKTLIIPNSIEKVGDFNYFRAKDSIIIEDSQNSIKLSSYKNSKFSHFSTDYLYIGRDIVCSDGWYDGLVGSSCRVLEYGDNVIKPYEMEYNNGYNNYSTTKNVVTIILGKNISYMFYGRNLSTLKEIYCKSQAPRGFEDLYGYFTNDQYMNIKLFVPQGCRQRYLETIGWNKFFLVEEYEVITGIENIATFNRNKEGQLWNLDGKLVDKGIVNYNGLHPGIYIYNGRKVVVK